MGPMGRTKGVVDIHLAQLRQLARQLLVVAFFPGEKPGVLEEQHLSRRQGMRCRHGRRSDRLGQEVHRTGAQRPETGRHRG